MFYWGAFYKSIAEMPSEHRPDDELLEDDEALDVWYVNYVKEMDRAAARRNRKSVPTAQQQQRRSWTPGN